jgi:paraquat-inducible protein B
MWPNLVWGIPLVALLIVGYLGVKAVLNRGEVVTVTFSKAAGAKPGETKVLYQGIEAGQLIKIEPNPDGRRLDFRLRLLPAARAGLRTDARFWLIGANPNLSDLNSLKAVLSGVAIGYAPGDRGEPADKFEGLDQAPVILPGDKGTLYALRAYSLNSIREGSAVLFHGQPIGKVTDIKFDGRANFRLQVFIYQPYDKLIRSGARFWKISPLRLSFGGGGITANLAPASTLLSGGIDLEIDTTDPNVGPSPPNSEFTLYSSHSAARQGLAGPTVRYEFSFEGNAGMLGETSAVTLLGFQIGEVESAHLDYHERTGEPYTLVTALLYPQTMKLTDADGSGHDPTDDWRSITDAALRRLIHAGFRARLQQTPPLVGDQAIALVRVRGAPVAHLSTVGGTSRYPSAPGQNGLEDVTAKADELLNKLNSIPIQAIGEDVHRITHNLDTLIGSPQMKDSLTHLHGTLSSLDTMMAQAGPQIAPLLGKLNSAAAELSTTATSLRQILDSSGGGENGSLPDAIRQISDAARSIQTLTDYLDRHPDALIRGKRPDK